MEIKILTCLTKEERKLVKGLSIKKDQKLFDEGEICDSIGIVVSGKIEISSYTIDGKVILYNTINPGEVFGNHLIFSNNPKYKGNVVAVEKTTLAIIKKEDLLKILQSNSEFLIQYLNIISEFGKKLNSRIKVLTCEAAEDRLMLYLGMNGREITFKSVTKLAEELAMSRESLSRCITRLEKKHHIVKDGHTIKLIK